MKKGYTEIVLILDSSGSMFTIKEATEKAVNDLIAEQKTIPGECKITFCSFDNEIIEYQEAVDINEFKNIVLTPRGWTGLYDAIGFTVTKVGKRLNAMEEATRPEKVIVIIATDGLENSSKEYKKDVISSMIEEQSKKYSWEFIYVGANQDAYAVGNSLNITNTVNYTADSKGVASVYSSISQQVLRSRGASSSAVPLVPSIKI